jgi:hypothetical protein
MAPPFAPRPTTANRTPSRRQEEEEEEEEQVASEALADIDRFTELVNAHLLTANQQHYLRSQAEMNPTLVTRAFTSMLNRSSRPNFTVRPANLSNASLMRRRGNGAVNPSVHPQFRAKSVCMLYCTHCTTSLCKRGMKAILLGNTRVELFSTDVPPMGVQLVYVDYTTDNCMCRIRDAACLGCGNVVGYHVMQPCETCLEACNNGNLRMIYFSKVIFGCFILMQSLPRIA